MKTLLFALALAAASTLASAQGTIQFPSIRIEYCPGASAAAPGTLRFGIFAGTSPSPGSLFNVGPLGVNTAAGFIGWSGPAPFPLPPFAPGSVVFVQVRGWESRFGLDWETGRQEGLYGETAIFAVVLGSTSGPGTVVTGLNRIVMCSAPPIPCSTPTVVPIVQQAYLKASNIHADDQFGTSVAISGDLMVAGAPLEDSSAGADSGAAYVFVRSGSSWGPPVQLKAPNPGAGDKFGSSVAIYGNTVVVGAAGEDSSATGVGGDQGNNSALNSGAAYVFVRNGMNWPYQAYLKASNTGADDQFGFSVAVSGNTVVVGAPGEDSNGSQADNSAPAAGAAYVFAWDGTKWSQQAYLKASNRESSDEFGTSVAVSENTVVVGSPGEDSNATGVEGSQASNSAPGAGAAYVFVWSGTAWNQQAYLKASNTGSSDEFGTSVAISWDTIVVGARGEDSNAKGVNGNQSNNSAAESGAAYVFTRNVTTWTQQAYLKGCNTGANDFFGRSVAVSADTVVVGAHLEDSSATGIGGNASDNGAADSGAAYVFVRTGTSWTQQTYLKASNTGGADNFAYSVGLSAGSLVVGATGEASSDGRQNDNGALKSGAAYAFANLGLPPPKPEVEITGSMAMICWPRPGTGLVLLQTRDLTPPVTWTPVPPPYVTNATEICVSVTVPSGVDYRFFKLCLCLP